MKGKYISVRVDDKQKKQVLTHIRRVQRTRSPNITPWVLAAIEEKMERERV